MFCLCCCTKRPKALLVTPEKAHDAVFRLRFGAHEVQKGVGWEEINLPVRLLHHALNRRWFRTWRKNVGLCESIQPKICHVQLETKHPVTNQLSRVCKPINGQLTIFDFRDRPKVATSKKDQRHLSMEVHLLNWKVAVNHGLPTRKKHVLFWN